MVDQQPLENTQHASIQSEGGNLGFHSGLHVPVRKLSVEDELHRASIRKNSLGTLNDQNIAVGNSAVLEENSVGDSNRSHSTSMLEKIFGGTLSTNEAGFGSAEVIKISNVLLLNCLPCQSYHKWHCHSSCCIFLKLRLAN